MTVRSWNVSLGFALVWIAAIAVAYPVGDFPLMDDWSFGLTVRTLLERGDFRPNGFASMTQVTNTLWGALFCLPVGFSFNALRVSTICIGVIGLLACRYLTPSRRGQVLLMATLGFNPIFFVLSNSFMTDILFVTLVVIALALLRDALRDAGLRTLVLGTGVAVLATLSRQIGLALPMAFAVACLLGGPMSWRRVLRALLPLLVCVGCLWGFQHWMAVTGREPESYNLQSEMLRQLLKSPAKAFVATVKNVDEAVLYLGLFLLPIEIWVGARLWLAHRRFFSIATPICLVGLLVGFVPFYLVGHTLVMPLGSNILIPSGVGPAFLGIAGDEIAHVAPLPRAFWLVVTIASVLGGAFFAAFNALLVRDLLVAVRERVLRGRFAGDVWLFYVFAVLSLAPVLLIGFFDRYFLPVIPAFAVMLIQARGTEPSARPAWNGALVLASVVLGGFALYATGGTRDYFAWSRARWAAVAALETAGPLDVTTIDGGFEFNGIRGYRPNFPRQPGKSWWWVTDDRLMLQFEPKPGYEVIGDVGYDRVLPPRHDHLLVLRRLP